MPSLLRCSALALLFPLAALPAQSGIAGKWHTEFDIGMRNTNGEMESMGKRSATITLAVQGDSVVGTWLAAPDASAPPPKPIRWSGAVANDSMRLVTEPTEGHVNLNGVVTTVKIQRTYTVVLHGDVLEGTVRVKSDGDAIDGQVLPFRAVRIKE